MINDTTDWQTFSVMPLKKSVTRCCAFLFCLLASQCAAVLCFREELCSFQREIEVLSEQYSQKCLENAHLAQALEAERQALRQCQRENQELNAHNQVRTHCNIQCREYCCLVWDMVCIRTHAIIPICSKPLVCGFCRSSTTAWLQRSPRWGQWHLRMDLETQTPCFREKSSMSWR